MRKRRKPWQPPGIIDASFSITSSDLWEFPFLADLPEPPKTAGSHLRHLVDEDFDDFDDGFRGNWHDTL